MKHIIKTIRNAIFLMIYGHFVEYDANGKCIHYKDSDGDERWYEYDDKGNPIHLKNSDVHEWWYDSDGNEHWYDADGNLQ